MNINKYLLILTIIFPFSFFLFPLYVFGASPQFLVSWRAQNYVPSWYQGKILPINGTPIEISFELIDNTKLVDLSKTKIRWYVNDKLIKNEENGLGIKSLKFTIPDYSGNDTEVRITIVGYRGSDTLDQIIRIPVVGPEVVINAPYPDAKISVGSSIFQAMPFFFNIKNRDNLTIEWSANGQKAESASGDPWELKLNIDSHTPSGFAVRLSATVQNILNQLETATRSIQLQIK